MASTTKASIRRKQAPAMRDLRKLWRLTRMGYLPSVRFAHDIVDRAIRELDAATKVRREAVNLRSHEIWRPGSARRTPEPMGLRVTKVRRV